MGCFPCFNTSKNRKLKKATEPTVSSPPNQGNENNSQSLLITVATEESTILDSFQNPFSESREDPLINDGDGKSNLNVDVKTSVDVSIKEVEIHSIESKGEMGEKVKEENGKLGVFVQPEDEKESGKLEVIVQHENKKEIETEQKEEIRNSGVDVETGSEKEIEKEVIKEEKGNGFQSQVLSDSSVSSYISYPPMHRYHNCVLDEEEEEDEVLIQQESSDSLFSLPASRKQSKSNGVEDEKEVNSPLKIDCSPELKPKQICIGNDHNQRVDSTLNPIENLSQWRTLKAKTMPVSDQRQEKENVNSEREQISVPISEEPNLKGLEKREKLSSHALVTTSLSSWLVESDDTDTVSKGETHISTGNSYSYSDGANSWKSFEDRPILGAWTVDEVRQISARSSPRKSPRRNPDEMPIIGTVGSYWNHTGQASDSSNSCSTPSRMSGKSRRNREDKASSCHSPAFRARLEKALERGVG